MSTSSWRWRWVGAGLLALLAPGGCGERTQTPAPSAPTVLRGRIDGDGGNQRTVGMRAQPLVVPLAASQVIVWSVDEAGARREVARGLVEPNGRFTVAGLSAAAGTLIVEALAEGSGTGLSQALVVWSPGSGSETIAPPLSHETTVEAQALVAMRERGDGERADPIFVQATISQGLALEVEDGAALAAPLAAAAVAYREVVREAGGTSPGAGQRAKAQAEGFQTLIAELDAAPDASAEDAAWDRFERAVSPDWLSAFAIDLDDHAMATAAAAFSLRTGVDTSADATPARREAARGTGAWLEAHATWSAERAALAGSKAQPRLQAMLDAAYEQFFRAIRAGDGASALASAAAELEARIDGSDPTGSVQGELLLSEQADPAAARAWAAAVRAEATVARTALDAALLAAVYSEDVGLGTGAAYAGFRARIDASAQGELALSPQVRGFVAAAEAHARGAIDVLLRLPTPTDFVAISGALRTDLGAQHGATTLAARLEPPRPTAATHARLIAFDAQHQRRTQADWRVRPETGRFSIGRAPRGDGALRVVELLDAQGRLVGGVIVPPLAEDAPALETAPVTVETRARSRAGLHVALPVRRVARRRPVKCQ